MSVFTNRIASLIAYLLNAATLALGGLFIVAPIYVIGNLNGNIETSDQDLSVQITLSKAVGGLLIAYTINILAFAGDAVKIHRRALSSQCLLGLSILFLGLLQDVKQTMSFVGIGSVIVLVGCTGLMASFYPMGEATDATADTSASANVNTPVDYVDGERPENTVPLLEESRQIHTETQGNRQNDIEASRLASELVSASSQEGAEDSGTEVESRIKGTKRLIKLAGPHTFYLYAGCIVLLIRLPFSLSIPHFVSETLGALARSNFDEAKLNIFLLVALGTVDAALDFWCVFLFGLTNLKITKGVRIDTFAAIMKQEMAFFDFTKSGDLASRLNSDCGEMGYDLTWFFRFSIESVVRIVSIVSYMLWRSPRLGACAISVVPIVAAINKRYGDFLNKNALEIQNALANANSVAQEAFSCIRTVIAFASEEYEYEKYSDRIAEHYDLNVKQLYAQGFYYMVISTFLINTIVQALLLYVGMIMIEHGTVSVEVLLAFMLYQSKLQNEVMNLFNSYTSLIKSSGAGDKVFELLDRKIPEPGTGHPNVNSGEESHSNQWDIKIQQLHFRYPSRPDQEILKGLDLHIPAGKTVALVGQSGCGKSTLMGLVQRFYDPCSGSIIVNDQSLKDINLMSHRSKIGVVTQDPVLFTGSIRDNIIYGKKTGMTDEEVINAAKLANAHNFIEAFPSGYDTQVGERGVQLSGGQKQRIAIARAIFSKPTLLLLDEATSALDTESEKLVQEALDHLLDSNHQMTTVVIAHRLQTVRNADNIVVLNEGRVSEQGSHDLLIQKNGIYHSMVRRADANGTLSDE